MQQIEPLSKSMIEGLRKVTTASVSDALDRIVGVRGFMSHNIKPLFDTKLIGPAATVLTAPSTDPQPPRMALELIDTVPAGTVLVISVSGEREDIAAWGGVMTAGALVRGLAGTVTDGGARDAAEVSDLHYPVFSGGVVPGTSLGRFINVGCQIPIVCGGVRVEPNDVIFGDRDGVVVIPRARAEQVLALALELEEAEARMGQEIRAEGSIRKAMAKLGRI